MQNKMTPGPWHTEVTNLGVVRSITGARIVSAMGSDRTSEEVEANARAIAAVPELIDALQNLLKRIDVYFKPDASPDWIAMSEAREALAKAGIE